MTARHEPPPLSERLGATLVVLTLLALAYFAGHGVATQQCWAEVRALRGELDRLRAEKAGWTFNHRPAGSVP